MGIPDPQVDSGDEVNLAALAAVLEQKANEVLQLAGEVRRKAERLGDDGRFIERRVIDRGRSSRSPDAGGENARGTDAAPPDRDTRLYAVHGGEGGGVRRPDDDGEPTDRGVREAEAGGQPQERRAEGTGQEGGGSSAAEGPQD